MPTREEIIESWRNNPKYQMYFGEKNPAIPTPSKPAKTGDFFKDLKGGYQHQQALTEHSQQLTEQQKPFGSDAMATPFLPIVYPVSQKGMNPMGSSFKEQLRGDLNILNEKRGIKPQELPPAHKDLLRYVEKEILPGRPESEPYPPPKNLQGESISPKDRPSFMPTREQKLQTLLKDYHLLSKSKDPKIQSKGAAIRENLLNEFTERDISPKVITNSLARKGAESIWGDLSFPRARIQRDLENWGVSPQATEGTLSELSRDWLRAHKRMTEMGERPNQGYYSTPEENLPLVGRTGLTPGMHPYDFGKIPLSSEIDPRASQTLRTGLPKDAIIDALGERGRWMTSEPILPEALEIKSPTGEWTPLLEYLKGKKP